MSKEKISNYTIGELENLFSKIDPQNEREEKILDSIMDLFWTGFSREGGDNV